MAAKNILVTGIGGNVGQGIIRNIRSLPYDFRIVGSNIADFSSGNYLCDAFYKLPYAYEDGFIDSMLEVVEKEKIDVIIPSTDFEIYYLAANRNKFSCPVAASDETTALIYLDKYETWKHHKKHGIAFAESVLPSQYKRNFKECILKPKKGRGSRGLHINPENPSSFSDEEYMVQELQHGEEITTAFYVTKQRRLHGLITMSRSLENGTTSLCKVISDHDAKVEEIILQMIKHSGLAGSANLQSIVTSDGSIIPFEVNCRISGTNSIRSNFGFKDVLYTLKEFLLGEPPEKPVIIPGVAVRVLLDVIYPNQTDYNYLKDNSADHFIF